MDTSSEGQNNNTQAQHTQQGADTAYKIILLDDDNFLLDMYTMKFSQEGYEVQACLSADEVISILRDGFAPDAIVFDLIMPEKDGFAFLRTLHEENLASSAVLVALTNQGEDEERKKTEELGVDAYIVKANTVPSKVVQTISDMIRTRRGA